MSKIVAIIGNAGIGKTTLVGALCSVRSFVTGMEGHRARPFHELFKKDSRYALANQVDFLLFRAEQERWLRSQEQIGLQDGGLEMDFDIFSRLFRQKGFLGEEEFFLCERLYSHIRTAQPPPEGIVLLTAPLEVIVDRFTRRGRPIEITEQGDLRAIDVLLDEWLSRVNPKHLLRLDVTANDPSYRDLLPQVLNFISNI